MTREEKQNIIEALCRKIEAGEKAAVALEVMQPVLDGIKADCYNEFLCSCKNNYQNIDNNQDVMIKSKVKVVELIESALNNAIRTGKDAAERKRKEAGK